MTQAQMEAVARWCGQFMQHDTAFLIEKEALAEGKRPPVWIEVKRQFAKISTRTEAQALRGCYDFHLARMKAGNNLFFYHAMHDAIYGYHIPKDKKA